MAKDRYDYDDDQPISSVPKKADIILRIEQEISTKQDELVNQSRMSNARIDGVLQEVAKTREETAKVAIQSAEMFDSVKEDYIAFKREMKFIAVQNESIFQKMTEQLASFKEELERLKTGGAAEPVASAEIDYETLADKLASRLPEQEAAVAAVPVEYSPEIDYDTLAEKVAARIPAQGAAASIGGDIDLDELVDKMVARFPLQDTVVAPAAPAQVIAAPVQSPVQVTAEIDYDLLAQKVAERVSIPQQQVVAPAVPSVIAAPVEVNPEIDYDLLADKVISRIPVQEEISPDFIAAKVAEQLVLPEVKSAELDYDVIAEKISALMPAPTVQKTAGEALTHLTVELDYDLLADKVAERVPARTVVTEDGAPVHVVSERVSGDIDYELLAEKISEFMPMQETVVEQEASVAEIDYELLANKVADSIVLPEYRADVPVNANVEIDEEELADRIALKIGSIKSEDFDILVDEEGCSSITKEITENLNYDYIAAAVAEKLRPALDVLETGEPDYDEMAQRISENITVAGVNEDAIADKAAAALSNYLPEIDTDEIADKVASQVISALPSLEVDSDYISTAISDKLIESQSDHDYDIVLDEDGINGITEKVTEISKERFNAIDERITELKDMIESGVAVREDEAPDYEEMARRISENITVAGVDEEAIAQKTAEVFSGYVINTDEIADKVADKVISALPAEEEKSEEDYNIVLDEDGINRVSEQVTEQVSERISEQLSANESSEERFGSIERDIAEIKELLSSGVRVVTESAPAAEAYEEEPYVTEESLVTVSDVIEEAAKEAEIVEEPVEEPIEEVEEAVEEVVEEPAPEVIELVEVAEPVEEPAEESEDEEEDDEDEESEGEDDGPYEEFSYEDLAGVEGEGGVDFANMMRYNRSFIARIIQSSDDQKNFYGEVRNALLSYKKVNSNIAWGAERFHKGRETIARFKIRGKTLVLYLALDPTEHEYSVYHHKDVSNNRSVAGTPMMIKIKSPRGVKKAVRLIDEMLEARGGIKRPVPERDYAAMYPFESIDELIEDGLVKDVRKNK